MLQYSADVCYVHQKCKWANYCFAVTALMILRGLHHHESVLPLGVPSAVEVVGGITSLLVHLAVKLGFLVFLCQ